MAFSNRKDIWFHSNDEVYGVHFICIDEIKICYLFENIRNNQSLFERVLQFILSYEFSSEECVNMFVLLPARPL